MYVLVRFPILQPKLYSQSRGRAIPEGAMGSQLWMPFGHKAHAHPGTLGLGWLLKERKTIKEEGRHNTQLSCCSGEGCIFPETVTPLVLLRAFLPEPASGLTPHPPPPPRTPAPFRGERSAVWGLECPLPAPHRNALLAFAGTLKWCGMCALTFHFNVSSNLVVN